MLETIIVLVHFHEVLFFNKDGSPRKYGGIELVAANTIQHLSKHYNVYVFGAGIEPSGGIPNVTFHSMTDRALREVYPDNLAKREQANLVLLHDTFRKIKFLGLDSVPIINHSDSTLRALRGNLHLYPNMVTMMHNSVLGDKAVNNIYRNSFGALVASISKAQWEKPIRELKYYGNIHNGIDVDSYQYVEKRGKYFAFLGRITEGKGADLAAQIAVRSGIPIKIAGIVDSGNEEFFNQKIKPLIEKYPHLVSFISEVNHEQKNELLKNALALLAPNRKFWSEPFGLMLVEAMACGTPVMGTNHGSFEEVIGNIGVRIDYIDDEDELVQRFVEAIPRVKRIERIECRKRVEEKFSLETMGQGYQELCENLLSNQFRKNKKLAVAV